MLHKTVETRLKLRCLVHVALIVFNDSAGVAVAVAEAVLSLHLPLVMLPKPNIKMSIGPTLHPITAPVTALKVAGVQRAVLEQLHSVAVTSVAGLHLSGRQRAVLQTAEARFMIAAVVVERFGMVECMGVCVRRGCG